LAAAALAAAEVFFSPGLSELVFVLAAPARAAGVSIRVSTSASGSVGLGDGALTLSNGALGSPAEAAIGGVDVTAGGVELATGGLEVRPLAATGAWLLPASNAASQPSSSPSSVGGGLDEGLTGGDEALRTATGTGANEFGDGTEGAGMPINVDLLPEAGGREVGVSDRDRASAAGGLTLDAEVLGGAALGGALLAVAPGGVMLGAGMPINVRLLEDDPDPGGALVRGAAALSDAFGSGGFDPLPPVGAEESLEARSSLMARSQIVTARMPALSTCRRHFHESRWKIAESICGGAGPESPGRS
jgi:hypothetical protein